MAEEDIDIDIDIDGDEPDDRLKTTSSAKTARGTQFIDDTPSTSRVNSSDRRQKDDTDGGSMPSGSGATIRNAVGIETESSIADEFQIPDWVTQDYHAQAGFDAGDMDEKSRQMIESMLAEEEFYSGRPSKTLSGTSSKQATPSIGGSKAATTSRPKGNPGSHSRESTDPSWSRNGHKPTSKSSTHDSKKRKSSAERSGQSKRTASEDARLNAISSVDLPSHNTRWTSEEDDRLREGLRLHGYGNWKVIAAVVATRNPLQVKNHARHLSVSDRVPHDVSTNTSDGEGLDRRSSAANSADEEMAGHSAVKKRHSRSKRVKRIDASGKSETDFDRYGGRVRRARSITSESGNDDFTGSEFGATSGYDTDNDDDARSTTKSPSLSGKGGSRSGSIGLGTPSPGLRPLFSSSSLSSPYTLTSQRTGISSMDEDEDEEIDVDIESTDEDAANRLNLARGLRPYARNAKSRSISPFSNSSTRSRLSSEFDSQSDRDLEDDDMDEVVESGSARKRVSAASPALSDTLGSSSDLYSNLTFNTSGSSINSIGAAGSFKPLLKDTQFHLQQQHQQHLQLLQKGGTLSHISMDKMVNSPKERRTVSFGAVHVAELQPDINSYDEDEMHSSEDNGSARKRGLAPLSETSSYLHGSTTALPTGLSPPVNLAGIDPTLTGSMVLPSSLRNGQGHKIIVKRVHLNQESEEDNYEEEEGSLGTGHKKLPHPAGILSLSRKGQKSVPKQKSHSASSSQAQGGNPSNSISLPHFSHGQLSITPAMTMNSTAMVLPTTPPNVTPRILDKTIITEEETRVHSEFFCNKASKTPERYQRIRNTIIQAWEKSPSTYLTKTSVRSALKDCGDVNAIGRVHSWLESIGAINVGMTASSPGASLARPRNGGSNSSKKRGQSEDRGWSSSSSSSAPRRRSNPAIFNDLDDMDSVWVTPPLRRRRVRNERGEWVNESDLEGHVIEHNVHSTKDEKRSSSSRRSDRQSTDIFHLDDEAFFERHGMTKEEMEEELDQERLAAQNAKYFAASELHPINNKVPRNLRAGHLIRQSNRSYFHGVEDDDDGDMEAYIDEDGASGSLSGGNQYDPFRLVPLRKYNAQNQAPFRVKVSSDAMLIMDFHSHLAETEVIGLLGGLYDEDEKILFILGVFPCRSISTGLQCEMDPESDVEARFFFSSKGFVVVGWYHSHPTFEPNPSIRDIENQSEHQTMFRRHELNVEPFVGVIVSPFDPRNLSFLSKFQFLSVSEQVDERLNCRLPFGYDREITRTNELSVSVFQQLSDLVRYYRTYEHRVDLSLPLRKGEATTTTRLDKLLKSISHHIFVDETNAKAFLSKVRELVIRGFQLDLPLSATAPSTASADATASASTSAPSSSTTLAGPPLRPTTPSATTTTTTTTTSTTTQPTSQPTLVDDGSTGGGSSTADMQPGPTTPDEVMIDEISIDQTPSPSPLAQPPPL